MKYLLVSALVALTLSQARTIDEGDHAQWKLFQVTYQKSYASDKEEIYRSSVFLKNLKFIREHNAKFAKGAVTFEVGINKFADLTNQEFSAKMTGLKIPKGYKRTGVAFNVSNNIELSQTVDWRYWGAVTPVKDQGECNACWAFSATGSLEGQHFLRTRQLVSLSEQNLIDCTRTERNRGCNGGYMDRAFTYIKKNKGIDTEASYPYEAKDSTCRYKPENRGTTDYGFVDIPYGNEMVLQLAVAVVGPIAVGIDSNHDSFQFYKRGVYVEPACNSTDMNHAVLAVGYGTDKIGGDYWQLKNSWGTEWGNKGYIKVARNQNNMCGITSLASFPIV